LKKKIFARKNFENEKQTKKQKYISKNFYSFFKKNEEKKRKEKNFFLFFEFLNKIPKIFCFFNIFCQLLNFFYF
jgi:hypothetical protein